MIDRASETYRFMDGRCRSLQRIPSPWRLQPPDSLPPFFNSEINLEADSDAFGIAPPAENRRTGKDQWKVSITLGTDGVLPDPDSADTSSNWRILYGKLPLGEPVPARWPLPEGFKAYVHPLTDDPTYYDPKLRLIVRDRKSDHAPNGFTEGVMWLTDREAVGFRIPYEGIARLDVLAKHFQALPEALIVPCPSVAPTTDATSPPTSSPQGHAMTTPRPDRLAEKIRLNDVQREQLAAIKALIDRGEAARC